jgi:hypothetical protein
LADVLKEEREEILAGVRLNDPCQKRSIRECMAEAAL